MYIVDTGNHVVRMVSSTGIITTIAGIQGAYAYSGDGGPATQAKLWAPWAIAVDSSGFIYIGDYGNQVVRKISAGIITTFAGTGNSGYSGDGGPATSATLYNCRVVSPDNSGNLYIADSNNNVIRLVNSAGIISTIAGTGTIGYSGDGGAATSAQLNNPYGVSADIFGNFYISEQSNAVVRLVNSAGIITTLAGTGSYGYNGDGIPASSAQLYAPQDVFADTVGNVFIADRANSRIRVVNNYGIITTIAGTGTAGSTGDGGRATNAKLNNPISVYVDSIGVYIAANSKIRFLREGYPHPTGQPSRQPSTQPTRQPSSTPTRPSSQPSRQPSMQPTGMHDSQLNYSSSSLI